MRARSLLSMSSLVALKNYFALREWIALLLVMLLLAAGLGWQNGLGRIDLTLYDQLITASARPARDDIIIVAIDDYSLAELGRWPWPRELHAQLIDQLSLAQPRAIGLDVILSEPERPPRLGDAALQAAMA
ncbi:MAG: CHASE2 domain-containing protein, partial [Oxalobacteraceae bacterium]|nr:CHASE2 domain-containing protein [Oxalobacteraceae bacterium]